MLDLHEYVKTRKGARQFAEVKTKYHNFDLDRYNRDTQFLLLVGNGRSMIEAYEACNNIDENPDTVAEIIESEIYDAEDLEPEPKESEVKYVGKKPIREMQTQNCLITLIIEGIAIFIFPVWMSGFRIALFDLTGLIPILLGIEFLYIRKEMPLIKKVFVTLPKWLMILAIISELPDIAAILIISWTGINNLFWIVYAIVTLIKYIKNIKLSNSNRIREHFNASASNANVPGSTHISFSQKAKDVFTTFTVGAMFIGLLFIGYCVTFIPVYILPIDFWLKLVLVFLVGTFKKNIFINVPLWIAAMIIYFRNDYNAFIDIMFWVSFVIDCFSTIGIILQLQQKRNGY